MAVFDNLVKVQGREIARACLKSPKPSLFCHKNVTSSSKILEIALLFLRFSLRIHIFLQNIRRFDCFQTLPSSYN